MVIRPKGNEKTGGGKENYPLIIVSIILNGFSAFTA